jgi:hypothetical protein
MGADGKARVGARGEERERQHKQRTDPSYPTRLSSDAAART